MAAVCTLGYAGLPFDAFVGLCRAQGVAAVVDIRSVPVSRQEDYDGAVLPEALARAGLDYVSMPALGDLEPGHDPDPAGFGAAVERVHTLASRAPVLLLCHEASPTTCRRTVVAELLAERGLAVRHLEPPGRHTA